MTRYILGLSVLAAFVAGCGQQQQAPPKKQGVQITVPGVDISVDPEGGAKVKAPGVDVKAGKGGAQVTAPGVDVNAGEGKVEVEAPKVKVNVVPDKKE
jgi:hypothetical protein